MNTCDAGLPLVSCLMPTANRRRFVPLAIRAFQAQDYPQRELVIVDDGQDAVADLVPPDDPRIRYVRLEGQRPLGAKRNLAVEAARGDLLLHWDDDDWHAPHRIRYQVEALLREGAEVCGLRRMLFWNPIADRVWLYEYPANQRPWLAGGSLLYTRAFWRQSPFPEIPFGEDTRFLWNRRLERALALPDYRFYVAIIHSANTSPKVCHGAYWSVWKGSLSEVMGEAEAAVRAAVLPTNEDHPPAPTYTVIMVVHNALSMVQVATLRTLRHLGPDARLLVVDNASSDGAEQWLSLLAQRGDVDLIRSEHNLGHGPALELARRQVRSPLLVTLDSDAYPLTDDWLPCLRTRLRGPVKVTGIRHHRDYIHPACLMIATRTLDDLGLSFLDEKGQASGFDVAERITHEVRRRGYDIDGLEPTAFRRRGSASEPVDLGSEYEGLVYHQWYTSRAATNPRAPVDDVAREDLDRSLHETLDEFVAEPRELAVVVGVRARPDQPERLRNATTCLRALNVQDLERWRYRIIAVEQDDVARLQRALAPLVDRYLFTRATGPYNRGAAFNSGAAIASAGALCLIDADVVVDAGFLRRGLEQIQQGNQAVLPYTAVVYLDGPSTESVVAAAREGSPLPDANTLQGRSFTSSQGGCIWVTADVYRAVGGHDERFQGWGWEDREFWERLSAATRVRRLPGRVLHLDHPRAPANDLTASANLHLYERIVHHRRSSTSARIEPALGHREWEHWCDWDTSRIRDVVRDELRQPASASPRRALAELAASLGDRLLDVGCGPGALWPYLEPFRPRLTWEGVDSTAAMLDVARELFPRVPVHHADAGALPFNDGAFDVVVLRHVLEHLPARLLDKVLAEVTRVARQAVVLAFFLPPLTDGQRHTERVGGGFLQTRWTAAELIRSLDGTGWRVDQQCDLLAGGPAERDQVWILRRAPAGAHAEASSPLTAEPLVSIIMPTFRRQHTIHRTVRLIQAQTYSRWELIVVDNAGDADYVWDDERIHVYRYAERTSASYARNSGLRHAIGELVCFFDDDDDMAPNYLERFVQAFREHPEAKMVRCGMVVSDGSTNFTYATPECCLRRTYATPTWSGLGPAQDQQYFREIVASNRWSEQHGDVVVLREALCRANTDASGGLRSGRL